MTSRPKVWCDDSTSAFVTKSMMKVGNGFLKPPIIACVIYGRPLKGVNSVWKEIMFLYCFQRFEEKTQSCFIVSLLSQDGGNFFQLRKVANSGIKSFLTFLHNKIVNNIKRTMSKLTLLRRRIFNLAVIKLLGKVISFESRNFDREKFRFEILISTRL